MDSDAAIINLILRIFFGKKLQSRQIICGKNGDADPLLIKGGAIYIRFSL